MVNEFTTKNLMSLCFVNLIPFGDYCIFDDDEGSFYGKVPARKKLKRLLEYAEFRNGRPRYIF